MTAEYPRDPAPREPVYREPVREREVIVAGDRDRGPGAVIATILGIAALVLIVWLLITNIGGSQSPSIEVPDQVDINVDDGAGGGGAAEGGDAGGGEAAPAPEG